MLVLPFLATLLLGQSSCVSAAQDYDFADPNSSYNKCQDSFSDLATSSQNLEAAIQEHASTLESSITTEDWKIGYSDQDKNAYKAACDEYNDSLDETSDDLRVFWMDLDTPLQLLCDWPQKNITGRTAEFYGVGCCLADTNNCRDWDSLDLVTHVWAQTEGLNCRALDATNRGDDATQNLAPGDQDEEDERLPFLTDDDVQCMKDTAEYISDQTGLASAVETFESSQQLTDGENDGVKIMGYPEEAAKAMKSACELNKSTWAFVKDAKFTCVIAGMETIAMHVHNFGKCLAKTQECAAMEPMSLLEVDLVDLGYNCWEDDEIGDEESETAGGVDQDDGDMDDVINDLLDDLGLSESDMQCMSDSAVTNSGHPELEDATEAYANSMEIDETSVTEMKLEFSEEYASDLKTVCISKDIGGYFTLVKEQEFDCSMMGIEINVKILNMADCLANTDECKNMDPLVLMEDMWQSMGLTCEEKTGATPETTDNGDKGDSGDKDPTIECLSESYDFLESSATISKATEVYQTSVQMNDPTKLGYSSASASEMEQVCDEQGGFWSFIESEDVTCTINGSDKCIHVYNFGGCLANSDECQIMDPFVLVKTFFSEVLGLTCRAKCDKNAAGHPSAAPHKSPSRDNSLSSQQNSGGSSSFGSKLPKFTTVAIGVLAAVAAIGLVGFLRYRARHGIDRNVRSSYEMTDISDLGFQVFT